MNQKQIFQKIKKLGYKINVMNAYLANRSGILDILISFDGKPAFIEIKIDNEKLSKLQERFIKEFYKSCFIIRFLKKEKKFVLQVPLNEDKTAVLLDKDILLEAERMLYFLNDSL